MDKAVQVFAWADAPDQIKALSPFGGDEDWAVVQFDPPEGVPVWSKDWPGQKIADRLDVFSGGDCGDSFRTVLDGRTAVVWIVAHG